MRIQFKIMKSFIFAPKIIFQTAHTYIIFLLIKTQNEKFA